MVKKYQCEIFNFVDVCSGVGIVWSTRTQTRESVMPLLSLSPLNVLTRDTNCILLVTLLRY